MKADAAGRWQAVAAVVEVVAAAVAAVVVARRRHPGDRSTQDAQVASEGNQ